ncbi:MAG: hypothetical protein ACFB15_31210 [Cyclobacteriaceae bacterium]
MKQPIETKSATDENQQNLDRYYWELNHGLPRVHGGPRCLRDDPNRKHRILLSAMKQTDALRKKIKALYRESPD